MTQEQCIEFSGYSQGLIFTFFYLFALKNHQFTSSRGSETLLSKIANFVLENHKLNPQVSQTYFLFSRIANWAITNFTLKYCKLFLQELQT